MGLRSGVLVLVLAAVCVACAPQPPQRRVVHVEPQPQVQPASDPAFGTGGGGRTVAAAGGPQPFVADCPRLAQRFAPLDQYCIPVTVLRPTPPLRDALSPAGRLISTPRSASIGDSISFAGVGGGDSIEEFSFVNRYSPRVNPRGRGWQGGPRRHYTFRFPERARQQLHLGVFDWSDPPSGADSDGSMISHFYFFPRKVVPAIEVVRDGRALQVTLPTGETVLFDKATKEVISGVLRETAPIDTSPNRHGRNFARIDYTGFGTVVRIDQRGESPEEERPWGMAVDKHAVITNQGRTCRVRPGDLWYQPNRRGNNEDSRFYFLYPTDAEFYRQILAKKCGWHDMASLANGEEQAFALRN